VRTECERISADWQSHLEQVLTLVTCFAVSYYCQGFLGYWKVVTKRFFKKIEALVSFDIGHCFAISVAVSVPKLD